MPHKTDGAGGVVPQTEVDRLTALLAASEARGEADRAAATAEQARLTFELGHRVKNTLSVVQALATQTMRASVPREEALEAFGERIMALSRANDTILGQGWTTATLRSVAEAVLATLNARAARLAVEGPEVAVPASTALSFAMALHELGTNAARHGALTGPDGRVDLTWHVDGASEPLLVLTWRESGGPPAAPPEKRGFGLKLIEQSLRSAFGRDVAVAFPPEGLLCSVKSPVPHAHP